MQISKVLTTTRPWTVAALASARPYGNLRSANVRPHYDAAIKPAELPVARTAAITSAFNVPYDSNEPAAVHTEASWDNEHTLKELSEAEARLLLCKIREEAMEKMVAECGGNFRQQQGGHHHLQGEHEHGGGRSQDIGDRRGHEVPLPLHAPAQGMGSFTSAPAVASGDVQDNNLSFQETTHEQLLQRCEEELKSQPAAFQRRFRKYSFQHTLDKPSTDKIDSDDSCIRIFQWNHLSQTLGTKNDQFVKCPPEALVWETRRWRLLEEILRHQPDVICLQEVDHFKLLEKALGSVGYSGRFLPKPDSPCIYLTDNNGPDGCAIFVRDSKFEVLSEARRILEVWRVQSNQVVLCMNLKEKESGKELCVATTHLKARKGALLSTLRNEQGKDMLDWLALKAAGRALVLCGDFNADPSEPVYTSVTNHAALQLSSAYPTSSSSQEELYTTWKIRETGEQKYILDYIFHSKQLEPAAILEMPRDNEIGEDRLPSLQFPSDHLSLVADFKLN